MKKIVFTGGGTLGHVMPNLYLIDELKSEYECFYIGSNGVEKEKVKKYVAKYYTIPAVKLVRGKVLKNLKLPFVLISSILKAKKILKKIKPDIIFSKGGYVSLPVCIAARLLKIPLIAHESDFSFGLANKIILKICNTMCVNFKNLETKSKKIVYTGPIFSKQFLSDKKNVSKLKLDDNKKTILIVGGSLGSKKINDMIYPILNDLLHDFNIIHIVGKGNLKVKSYENYNVMETSADMVNLYNLADFVIGRSGAGVTAESFYKKLPMILIPLENGSSRGDQLQNANYYVNQGVAKIIREKELTPTLFLKTINNFNLYLNKYQNQYKNIQIINGKDKILEIIKNTIK
ncbi:MAG: UDP-N-acetylglucosamine--N-acetylmuramyl-(pentapeptide) pyrophosphoryl-undecaprenol N-acetylglucosamine transferase [Clostridia bacterium]|nr:UDP-N-acetylglucosamine--N-acetylmuramyl-(pentapeptide) pyrophosphoryl-undecaprenol N-acetylglucosamine transferase [Clostridia bacterium]